jgi:protein-glutamine gamma-glutamyltransferase
MKTPPFLMMAALALWGWQANWLMLGLALGAALEASRLVRTRWELGLEDFRRLWSVTTLLVVGAALFLLLAHADWESASRFAREPNPGAGLETWRDAARMGLMFVLWLPLLLYPFVLVHTYSRTDELPWSTVSPFVRWRQRRAAAFGVERISKGFRPAYPYLLLALLAGVASDRSVPLYYPALALLTGWALWHHRSPRFRTATWCGTMAVVILMGFAGVQAFRWTFERYQDWETRWLSQLSGDRFQPHGVLTDIGAISRRKASGRIVLRIRTDGSSPPPLLREAVFNQYRAAYWSATDREFAPVTPHPDGTTWPIARASVQEGKITIAGYTRKGETLLALPHGSFEVSDLPAGRFETNRFGVAQVGDAPRLASYSARYATKTEDAAPPNAGDLDLDHLPEADREAILRVARDLGLNEMSPRAVMDGVQEFLLRNFRYTLDPSRSEQGGPVRRAALEQFLFESRRGHCEHFATATVLLLRAGGIPARYVVGYAVEERQGDMFIVRARHAHAWGVAFLDGRWEPVDNTPGGWIQQESNLARWWEPIQDRISQAWFRFTHWRQRDGRWRLYLLGAASGLLLLMAARELRGSRWRRSMRAPGPASPGAAHPGFDSEYYTVEEVLARGWLPRPAAEPVASWIGRLPLSSPELTSRLRRLVGLHYRLRFDPAGLSESDRSQLRHLASALTATMQQANSRSGGEQPRWGEVGDNHG